MSLFGKNGGFMDVIRCDEPHYLIWKWHPTGSEAVNHARENAIRWGSSLRVKDGEVAVFAYKQKEGTIQDYIVGPFDQIIETFNLPVLTNIVGLAYDGGTPFQAEVYFINLAQIVQVKFGVSYFDVYDPRFDDFGVPVAVRGTVTFKIEDYRGFIKLHRLNTFRLEDFQNQIRDAVARYVKDVVANAPSANNIPLVQIEKKTAQITDVIEFDLGERIKESFGVLVSGVDIGSIELDKSSENYRKLMSVTKDVTSATIKAETDARVKNIADKQRLEIENYGETLRINREEGQYAVHKQTQSANISALQIEKQAEVGIAGANALGQMGANGAGDIILSSGGGDGGGMNMAAMMASMAVGGAVGQNIASSMNNIMSGINQPVQAATPPPIPNTVYYVAINGQSAGPFDMAELLKMVIAGTITKDNLVWKAGMESWVKFDSIQELNSLFSNTPPPVPTEK